MTDLDGKILISAQPCAGPYEYWMSESVGGSPIPLPHKLKKKKTTKNKNHGKRRPIASEGLPMPKTVGDHLPQGEGENFSKAQRGGRELAEWL